jgi:hypothetical protein
MVLQTDGKPKGIAACFYYKVVVLFLLNYKAFMV